MKYFKQFNHKLQPMGLVLRDVEADGNCLFRAVADQLTGDEENYNKYRQLTIRQLKRNQHFFHDFLPEGFTIKTYTSRMSEDGVWGGHMELQAISDALQLDIVVHTMDNYYIITHKVYIDCWQSLKQKLCFRKPKHRQIHIAFHSGKKIINHYSSVRMIGDDSCKPAKQPQLFCQPSEQSTTDDSY